MFETLTDRTWLWVASACYAVGFLLGTSALLRERQHSRLVMYFIISAGYAIQTFGLYQRGLAVQGCPLGNTFEIFQFTAWSATSLYLVVGATFRLSLLGYFTSLLACALTTVSLSISSWDATRRVGIFGNNAWIEFHAALAIFSYGVFALLSLTSILFLLRNYSLKHKHLRGSFAFLPSILDLDHIGVRLMITGVVLLVASLAVGSVYWLQTPDSVNAAKLITTVSVALAYVIALVLRFRGKLVAKRFAWVCIILFGTALISLGPVDASRQAAPVVLHP